MLHFQQNFVTLHLEMGSLYLYNSYVTGDGTRKTLKINKINI